jgi:glycerol kinase
MKPVLAIDQGTSSSRGIVFATDGRRDGRMLGSAQREFDQLFPRDGWVEQDAEVLWQTTLAASRDALAAAGVSASDLLGIGITNQRETTLVWDVNTGEVVYNAIVWQDRRTAARCETIRADGMEETIRTSTGLVVDPYFSSTKLAWLLDEVPGLRGRADAGELRFGTVDTFVIWRLTKGRVHATDATNASRTQLYNLAAGDWDPTLLDYFGIPRVMLPTVLDSADDYGQADAEWLGAEVPILGVAGDQQAALVGQACFAPGMTKSTYGTGCFLVANTGSAQLRSEEGLLTTVGYRLGGETTFALEGSIFSAGVAVKWLRDQVGLIDDAAETQAAAMRTGGDTGGVYLVPAFTGLGTPHWHPDARGVICGLTLDTNRDQLITATLESVAFQSAELLEALARDGAAVKGLRVDGGMVVNDWLCQFLADLTEVDVERPAVTETTALGAAMLATLGAGEVDSLEAAAGLWQLDQRFSASMDDERRASLMAGWNKAVERALL